MEDLQIGRTRYRVPSTWNELTRAQLLAIMGVLYGPEHKLPVKLRLLSVLSGVPLAELLAQPELVVVQLYPLTDFVASEEHRLTTQLLPEVRPAYPYNRHRYVGPASSLKNLLFGEFIFADTYFRAWATHRSAEALDLFLATLYRPAVPGLSARDPRWRGDRREPFNEHRTEYLAQRLARLPDAQKLAITTWYRGCRTQLELEFPEVFDVHEQTTTQKGDWGQVLRKLSGGAFGPLEQTAAQHTRTLLAEMQDRARHYNSLKK